MPVALDLTDAAGVSFEFKCADPTHLEAAVFYYRSGKGWFGNRNFACERRDAWVRVQMPKLNRVEGTPTGWGHIDAVRVTAKFSSRETACAFDVRNVQALRGDGEILVVRGASCGRETPQYRKEILDFADTFAETLALFGLTGSFVEDDDLAAEQLDRAKVLVLPYNRSLPPEKLPLVKSYLARGGRLLMCYQVTRGVLPPALERRCQAAKGAAKPPDRWAKTVREGNVHYFGHVWRAGNAAEDLDFFTQLFAALDPEYATRFAAARAAAAEKTRAAFRAMGAEAKRLPGERRIIWAHSPLGPRGREGDWEKPVAVLARAGFTDLLVNMCWGYGAAYDSHVLPRAPIAQNLNWDPLTACRTACRRQGVKMHVWRVCWQVFAYPRSAKNAQAELAAAGRMQVDFRGQTSSAWLCPNHPENRALEQAAMLELGLEKDVDGIHYDYFRYADGSENWCFCPRCRALFEKNFAGGPVADWPAAVRRDPALRAKWGAFKRHTLSTVLKPVAERLHRERPGLEISIAARPNPQSACDNDGQDWPSWCAEGWLDFVCPMDYHDSALTFEGIVRTQLPLLHGRALYPGMGFSHFPADGEEPRRFIEQVRALRRLGVKGFTLYSYTDRSEDFLAALGEAMAAAAR